MAIFWKFSAWAFGARFEDGGELGDAIYDLRHLCAEICRQRFLADAGIFKHVVYYRGGYGLAVHAHGGEDIGDGQRMGDVVVTGAPELAGVGGFGEIVGAVDGFYVLLGQVFAEVF